MIFLLKKVFIFYIPQKTLDIQISRHNQFFRDFYLQNFTFLTLVEYDEYPVVKEGVEFKIRLKFHQLINDKSVQGYVNISLPEGWTANYSKSVTVFKPFDCYETKEQNVRGVDQNVYEFTVTPNSNIQPVNRVYVHLDRQGHPMPSLIPITLMG